MYFRVPIRQKIGTMCFTAKIFWRANEMGTEKIIKLSVRNLVEFILKEGDIDNRISGTLDKDAMLMGGRLHRKIQRMMGSNYQAEVSLKLQLPCNGLLWVSKKQCKTKLERTPQTEQLYQIIARAENWLRTHNITVPIFKWETKKWGEIPADFGRKG